MFFQGDLVLQCDYLFEALTKLCVIANKQNYIKVVQGRYRIWNSCRNMDLNARNAKGRK